MLVTLKLKYGVNDMFQHLRPGNTPFLIDMADQKDRCAALLRIFQNSRTALAYLRNTSGRRFDHLRINGLYRVDNQEVGLNVLGLYKYLFEIGLTENETIWILVRDAVGTEFQLATALLAGDVKRAESLQPQNGLQDEGRFPDTRFPADQDQ